MGELSLEVTLGGLRPIPVPPTSVDVTPLGAPCILMGWSFRDASGDVSQETEGSQVAPGAGAVIATLTVTNAGTYNVAWTVELVGPVAAGDTNNFGLYLGAALQDTSVNLPAAGEYPQPTVELTLAAGAVLSVKAIGAGTAGVTYGAQLSITPITGGNGVVEIQDAGMPIGESSVQQDGVDSQWFGPQGVHCMGQIKVHVVQGIITGVVYAIFDR
jgi:hypothetical protein